MNDLMMTVVGNVIRDVDLRFTEMETRWRRFVSLPTLAASTETASGGLKAIRTICP